MSALTFPRLLSSLCSLSLCFSHSVLFLSSPALWSLLCLWPFSCPIKIKPSPEVPLISLHLWSTFIKPQNEHEFFHLCWNTMIQKLKSVWTYRCRQQIIPKCSYATSTEILFLAEKYHNVVHPDRYSHICFQIRPPLRTVWAPLNYRPTNSNTCAQYYQQKVLKILKEKVLIVPHSCRRGIFYH